METDDFKSSKLLSQLSYVEPVEPVVIGFDSEDMVTDGLVAPL